MSELCENFEPNQWKPTICKDCSRTREEHRSISNDNIQSTIEQSTEVALIPCRFGLKCYRTNPQHFQRYSHPLGHQRKINQTDSKSEELKFIQIVEEHVNKLIADRQLKDEEIKKLREDKLKMIRYYQSLEKALAQEIELREKCELEKKRILAIPRAVPSYWGLATFSESYREIQLLSESTEFSVIRDLMNSTIGTHGNKYGTVNGNDPTEFLITNVKRIRNTALWHEYCFKKDNIIAKNNHRIPESGSSIYLEKRPILTPLLDKQANEYWLFHGSSHPNLKSLLHDGYDPRISNLIGMFGGGFYLAENASKSNQYIPCPQCNKNSIFTEIGCNCSDQENLVFSIILYRVVLGDVHIALTYDKDKYRNGTGKGHRVRRPPAKTGCEELYDSVMGESKMNSGDKLEYREFIVYEKGQAYPEYVIEYKRSAKNALQTVDKKHLRDRCENFLKNTFKIRPE